MIRSILRLVFLMLLSVALSGALVTTAEAKPSPDKAKPFPDRIKLPVGFLPEGITIGPGGIAYFGSRATGDIYAVSLRTGEGSLIDDDDQDAGLPAVGLKIDNQRRLFVAGGNTGTGRVLDARTGELLAIYTFTSQPRFINDVVLTRDYAWFTNSLSPELYGVPLGPGGELGKPADVVTLPLTGDWNQEDGFNANGIAVTPDRKALLVVQSATGFLFRVDPETGVATRVDLGETLLTNGDGLLVVGTTLYAVQNQLNQVAVIKLDPDGTSGVLIDTLTSPDFQVPTTVAAFGNSLYLPNARFGNPEPLTAEYWVTRIDRH
ncbi:MAG TPA: superoxide dismutase [Propionibacteriaceae bacterium]|jgi:sugar lactone lactonase YvrE|nr:superoxide dismutase [Propionibacteriaceae bacterium]